MRALDADHRLDQELVEKSRDAQGQLYSRTVFAHNVTWIQRPDFYPAGFGPEAGARGETQLGIPSTVNLSENPLLAETPWYRLVKAQADEELVALKRAREEGREIPDGYRLLDDLNSVWWTLSWFGNEENPLGSNGPAQFAFALHTKSGKLFNSPCDYITYVYREIGLRGGWGPDDETHDREFEDLINLALKQVEAYDDNYAAYLEQLKGRSILDGNVNLDPNQFIQLQDKMKRVLVREVTP